MSAPVPRDLDAARDRAAELAAAAGRLQLSRRSTVVVEGTKAHANDLVSDVDRASEKLVVDGLRESWPDDGVIAEEGSAAPARSGWCWVIDPLDGTRNYVSGAGPWSVCLALEFEGRAEVALVHDPAAGETFTAVRGGGAWLESGGGRPQPIRASAVPRLAEALVGLSFHPSPGTKRRMAGMLGTLLPIVGDIRRLPAALCLCYLAAGRLDGALVLDTRPWDVAAGLLVAGEAGVVVGSPEGSPELLVAAAGTVWGELSGLHEAVAAPL